MFFWTQFALKRGHYGPHPRWKKKILPEITKADHQLSESFLFYQNIICFDWVMNLFLSWVMFSIKKVSFPAKTAVLAVHYFLHAFLSDYFCFAFQICAHVQFFGKIKTNASCLYSTKALLICLENGFSHSIQVCFLFPKVETLEHTHSGVSRI